jgi:hypothetical protein
MTNEGTPLPGETFVFPSYGNVGPPYIATLSLPGLTIGLPVWLFSTPVISNAGASDVSTPPTHQPHVDLSPSSPIRSPSISPSSPSESSKASSQVDKKKKKQKEKKKNQKGTKPPTTSDVGSKQPTTINSTGSVDEVDKIKTKNLKPKFPCSLCKGDHFLRDFPGLPKVLEMWSSTSSAPDDMLVMPHQLVTLRLVRRRQLSNFLVCYAKVIIILTFVLVWMRLLLFWKSFNFQLVIVRFPPTHR